MMKALLVTILAAGAAFGGAAKEAKALTAEETAALLAGLVVVGVIASKNNNRAEASPKKAPLTIIGRSNREYHGRDNRRNVLPARCVRRFETNRGVRNLAGERCLERNGVRTARLPDRCEVRVRTGRGLRDAYFRRCLEREGFRFRDDRGRHDGRRVLGGRRDRD